MDAWAQEEAEGGMGSIDDTGKLSPIDDLRLAREVALCAVIDQPNSIVDGAVLVLATRIRPTGEGLTRQALSRSRKALLKEIERHYRLETRFLPSWYHVDQIRQDANALMHRYGMRLPKITRTGLVEFKHVKVGPTELRARIAGVREWLLALWEATEVAAWEAWEGSDDVSG